MAPVPLNSRRHARVGLMPRGGTQAENIWCYVDPTYVFHVANAHGLPDGRAALDLVAYAIMFADGHGGPDMRPRGLERWAVNPASRTGDVRMIDDAAQGFRRVDERCFGQPYRFAYAIALEEKDGFATGGQLYKHDIAAGTRQVLRVRCRPTPRRVRVRAVHERAAENESWLVGTTRWERPPCGRRGTVG